MEALMYFLVFASGVIAGLSFLYLPSREKSALREEIKSLNNQLVRQGWELTEARAALARIQRKVKDVADRKVGTPPKLVVTPAAGPVSKKRQVKQEEPKAPVVPPRRVVQDDLGESILLGATLVAAGIAVANSFDDSPTSDSFSSGGGGDFAGGGASEEF